MNRKNIKSHLNKKINDWLDSIDDQEVANAIKKDAIVTGGALVSLLTGESPHDYDIYFRTKETVRLVAEYYAKKWNDAHDGTKVSIIVDPDTDKAGNPVQGRVKCWIQSDGNSIREYQG